MPPPIFEPPTAEQMQAHLSAHALRAPSRWLGFLPLMLGLGVLTMLFFADLGAAALLLWAPLLGLMIYANARAYRLQQLQQRTLRIQELVLLCDYPQSLQLAWRTLPSLATSAALHHQAVACTAQCLTSLRQPGAAIVAYDYLLDRLPLDEPVAYELRAHRAMAQLATDRLTDADQAIRQLRHAHDRFKGATLAAWRRMAQLFQQVRTHHDADAVAESDTLLDELRPLGVEAGYGYGLLAYCYHRSAQHDEDQPRASVQARVWWSRAALLLSPQTLAYRYPELEAMSDWPLDPRIEKS